MSNALPSRSSVARGHRVRELVYAYRPLRDHDGSVIGVATTGVMVVHNHPSGDATPSPDDGRLTRRLCAAAAVLDIPLLDHLIVSDDQRYYSFREAGVIGGTPWVPL